MLDKMDKLWTISIFGQSAFPGMDPDPGITGMTVMLCHILTFVRGLVLVLI